MCVNAWEEAVRRLPVDELDRRDHEIAVRPNSMPEDGRQTEAVLALAVVVSERDFRPAHAVLFPLQQMFVKTDTARCKHEQHTLDVRRV